MSQTHAEQTQELATKLEFAAEMEAAFTDIVGTPAPEEKGEATVIWYLRALQRLEKQMADTRSVHAALVAQAAGYMAGVEERIARQCLWLHGTYLSTVEAVTKAKTAHSGKKSFDFCYGVCSFKKQQDKVDLDDEAAVLDWCELHLPAAIRVKTTRSVDKKAIKAHYKDTGEIPPGVTVTPGVEQFYVKPTPLALPSEPKLLGTD